MKTLPEREISCRITRTVLMYVREFNHGGLGDLLEGLDLDEAYLSDVNNWVSHEVLQTLYQRMIAITADPNAVYKMTLASERFQSMGFLDRLIRLVGNPKFIYTNAPKYNRLLKTNGDVYIREIGPSWVVLEDRYHDSGQKTRHDCDYTRGILTGLPTAFGMPAAHVEELECQVRPEKYGTRIWPDAPVYGAEGCLYRVHFGPAEKPPLWHRLIRRPGIYRKAIEDLLEANRTIQEKYNEVIRLAADLDSANKQLLESKQRLESSTVELKASEHRYRLLAENLTDVIWIFDLQSFQFEYISPSIQNLRGLSPEEAMSENLQQHLLPESFEYVMSILSEELEKEKLEDIDPNRSRVLEIQQPCKDGTYIWVEAKMTFIRDEKGQPNKILGITRDIRERRRAQAALNAEKERLVVTLRSIGDGVITTDRNGAVTLINPVAEALTGWTEALALGKPLEDIFRIIDSRNGRPIENPVQSTINKGPIDANAKDALLINKNGSEAVIAQKVSPILDAGNHIIGVVVVFRNVTENRRMEKELQKVEKLESLGMLAGGIAHDFNNFLSGIIGNLSLAKLDIHPSDRSYTRMQEMEKAALRAKNLTQQLLTFAKGGDPIKKPTELTRLVEEAAGFAARGSNVRCEFDFKAGPLFSDVDEGQIVQVIHNLILNAVQAMPEGGTVHVRVDSVELPTGNAPPLKPGPYVKLTIQDQGTGIKEQHVKYIFDPYFTTKHKGSGLGLAVAYAVIDKHAGRIAVTSTIGTGTAFDIYLPSVAAARDMPIEDDRPLATGSGRILVMDDEDFIRELAEAMLDMLGYEVSLARDGEEAIARYKEALENGRGFDAVILDLTVPGAMGGKEAFHRLREIDKNVKAIVSSGYSNDPVMSNYTAYGFCHAVQKPYRVHDLGKALQAVLKQ